MLFMFIGRPIFITIGFKSAFSLGYVGSDYSTRCWSMLRHRATALFVHVANSSKGYCSANLNSGNEGRSMGAGVGGLRRD